MCSKCGREVGWQNVAKGLELAKGKYYIISKEEFEKIKPRRTDYLEILEFIDLNVVDPLFFDSHYFAVPQKEREKAYFLFREALSAAAKAAIGVLVMHEKEHLVMLSPYKKGLLVTTLNYAYEIRDINQIEILKEEVSVSKKELELAKELIKKFYTKEFDIGKYKDTFAEKLKEAVRKKLRGEAIRVEKKPEAEKNLMKALELSLKAR
jgi:DNA end-binding protein Ku